MTQRVLGFDVGGSSVKAGAVDVRAGRLMGVLISARTPLASDPNHLMSRVVQ
jgi:sugar (pentulose or hexulose) kinase